MEFFHFGPEDELFGSFVPAPSTAGSATSVAVLCYPFGQEYMRAHRAFRQVAVLLSRQGVPVFRFDYAGTGDSTGRPDDVRLDRWVDDVALAIDEARRRSGASRIRLAGLRLGGTLGALASAGRDDVERLVLWDPIVRGASFVDDLARRPGTPNGTWWVNGFPVSDGLRDDIEPVDLCRAPMPDMARILQVISHADAEFDDLGASLESHPGGAETRIVPSPSDWNYMDAVGGILIPREMVKAIVQALAD